MLYDFSRCYKTVNEFYTTRYAIYSRKLASLNGACVPDDTSEH